MTDPTAEFAAIQAMHPSASLHTEGGNPVVLLPNFKFRAGGRAVEMALLLYPSAHSGYVTRLFFERKLEGVGKSQNWKEHTVLSRKWWAPSWKDVVAAQPWTSMLGAHLRAVA
ncbi:MAG: hypothetical protein EPN47_17740 [Acidobacteria bacterium]|nr:MAG: hypothetical protein EPN47_17740 [Acidobacteriota bacterium]